MQQEIFFSLSGMKTQKMNTQESQESKFEETVRKRREQADNIFTVVFAFLI